MSDTWFTSDTHFYHDQDFLYAPRGFDNVEEMNEAIIERWNAVVKPNDHVYHLGDVVMQHYDANVVNRLNGFITFIRGNHDTDNKINGITEAGIKAHMPCLTSYRQFDTSKQIKFGKLSFFLCHYPVLTANFDDKHFSQHVICLHGHTHQQKNWLYPNNPFLYHVGLDSHDCRPVHIDEVITDIRQRYNTLVTLGIQPSLELYAYPQ